MTVSAFEFAEMSRRNDFQKALEACKHQIAKFDATAVSIDLFKHVANCIFVNKTINGNSLTLEQLSCYASTMAATGQQWRNAI